MRKSRPGGTCILAVTIAVAICAAISWAGYCGGWLARQRLLFQLLRRDVEIVLPACSQARVVLSPSGRTMAVLGRSPYLEVLPSRERRPLPTTDDRLVGLVTDEILVYDVWGEVGQFYLLEARSGRTAPIAYFHPALSGDEPVALPPDGALEQAEHLVYFAKEYLAVVLGRDPIANPELNFILKTEYEPSVRSQTERFKIPNWTRWDFSSSDLASPAGEFFYRVIISGDDRQEGIYLTQTGQHISNPVPGFYPIGWAYDGVVLYNCCEYLIPLPNQMGLIEIPQPVVKLKLPSAYVEGATSP